VAEAIHCPSCTTRYRLRSERLKPAVRRAKCFACGYVFPVGDLVRRLLAPPPSASVAESAPVVVEATQPGPGDQAAVPVPSPALSDLHTTDTEVQEKALITVPDSLPEARAEAPSTAPSGITESALSGYSSAREAIEKLFGDTPLASPAMKVNRDPNTMDMEATLSALESTLGVSPAVPVAREERTPSSYPAALDLSGEDLVGASTATLRISQEDLLAAIASAPTPPAPLPAPPEPTVPLRAADRIGAQPQAPRAFAPYPEAPDAGAELLRLKIGEDIYGDLTMPQLIAWVGEGRILENHLVARQHSENWLEAQKVPGLRPVFERLRRERAGSAPSLDSGPSDPPPKKSLFGGLFGRN
jgi:predicted Zn finger-like uncharacterized protein